MDTIGRDDTFSIEVQDSTGITKLLEFVVEISQGTGRFLYTKVHSLCVVIQLPSKARPLCVVLLCRCSRCFRAMCLSTQRPGELSTHSSMKLGEDGRLSSLRAAQSSTGLTWSMTLRSAA